MDARRSGIPDFLAVLVCATVFSAGGWSFWTELTKSLKPAQAEEIGTLVFKRKTAQRKYSDGAIWEDLGNSSPLYSFDSVRTASDSEAKLILKDGTSISLEESTLILLDYGADSRNIEFISGNITAARSDESSMAPGPSGSATPPPVTITSKGSKVEVKKDAQASLAVDSKGKLDVAVSKGTVDLTLAGKTQEVKENEKAVVQAEAKTATVERIPLSMTAPAHDSFWLCYGGDVAVAFSWKSDKAQEKYLLRLSRTSGFQSTALSREAAGESLELRLAPGTWWARAEIDQGAGLVSASAPIRVTVVAETPPVPVSPQDGAVFAYRSATPSLRFMWEGSAAASGFDLEISRDAAFSDIAQRVKTQSPLAVVTGLPEGAYSWRVRPAYAFQSKGDAPRSSEPRSFEVQRIAELQATEALSPRDGETVQEKVFREAGLRFSWKSAPEAVATVFAVARDKAMSDVVLRSESRGGSIDLNSGIPPGTYWWQAVSRAEDGTQAPASAPRSFVISDKLPELAAQAPAEGAEFDALPGAAYRFSWNSDSAGSFALEVSADKRFGDAQRRETAASFAELKDLAPGQYYWRVSAIGPKGIVLATTEARAFLVLSPLPAPKLLSPQAGEALDLVNAPGLDFSWQAVDGADSYAFRLSAQDGRVILDQESKDGPAARLTDVTGLKPGQYKYEVQSLQARPGRIRASAKASVSFTVKRNARIKPPELLEPVDGAIVGELDVKRSGLFFVWKPDPLAPTVRFVLARDPGFREILSEQSSAADRSAFKRLDPGEYYWSVTGVGPGGETYAADPRRLTVRKAPPLADPVIVSPAAGEKVEMAKKDSLAFSWKPVQDATHYAVSLVFKKSGETVGSAERIRGARWEFKDLSKLDVGDFVFTVQAFAIDAAGAVERKSAPESAEFAIKLTERVDAPEILSPQVFYLE
jgi:hypothetical protein